MTDAGRGRARDASRSPLRAMRDERGAATVDFVLIGVLVVVIAFSIVQFALAVSVRNTLVDAAGQGARFAALAGNDGSDGVARTRDAIDGVLGPGYGADISASTDASTATGIVTVTVRARLPVVGLLGPANQLEVRGRSVREPR